jgi:hypothetical protein
MMIALFSAGCMQVKALPHMDELLMLKGYSEEKDAQIKWVEGRKQVFEQLVSVVKDGSIKNYPSQESVVQAFGDPVLSDRIQQDNQPVTRWLYRHPIQKFATDRVYLYFNADGHLLKSELIPST